MFIPDYFDMKSSNHSLFNQAIDINQELLNTLAEASSKEWDIIAQQFSVGLNGYMTLTHSMLANANSHTQAPEVLLRAINENTHFLHTLGAATFICFSQAVLGLTYPYSRFAGPVTMAAKALTKPLAEPSEEDIAAEIGLRLENCL